MHEIEPYTKWASPDGKRVLHVNSVGWRGDKHVAFGIALGEGHGVFELSFNEIRADYRYAGLTPKE